MSTKKSSSAATGKAVWIIGVIIGGVIAVTAVVSLMSSNDKPSTATATSEFSEITVTGDVLPPLGDAAAADPAVGMTAPVLTGKGFTGNVVTTTPGTPTLLVFLAHWCQFCQREVPLLVEWDKAGKFPAGVDVIAIATATDAANPNYPPSMWLTREEFPVLWPVMADSKERTAGEAFGLSGYPFFTLLDASGKVVKRMSGEIPMEELTVLMNAVATS